MWFEARRQEKKLRNIMVDHKKRAERRRMFYERIKKDPAEFMQIHGRQYKIHLEQSVSQAAESPAIFRPWQGDANILIDRFDARSHLDFIQEYKSNKSDDKSLVEEGDWNERLCNYERYRILVVNEFEKVTEEKFLKQIFMEENFGQPVNTLVKAEEEKKKKLADQKAAIAFTYDDGPGQSFDKSKFGPNVSSAKIENDESSESEESEPDIDKRLDVSELTNEQCKELNNIGTKYQIRMGDFVKCLWEDHDEEEQLQSMKDMESEKAAMAGKHSRRERKLLKEIRIRERGLVANPLGMLRVEESKKTHDDSSSSSSSDSEEDHVERIQYITSFGGTGSDGEGAGVIQGPAPPPSDTKKRLQELRKRRSSSSEKLQFSKKESSKPKSYMKRNSSRSRSRSRSRSGRRRRSRSSSWSRRRRRRSSSRDNRPRRRSRSRSRSNRRRSHSTSKHRRSRSRSREKRREPQKKPNGSNSSSHKQEIRPPEKINSPKQQESPRGKVSQESPRRKVSQESPRRKVSPARSSSNGSESDLSTLSIKSDMSDSEQERRQVENTRRRLKKTKRSLRRNSRPLSSNPDSTGTGPVAKTTKTVSIVDKLKMQTQKALKKTLAKDKEEERQRLEEMKREQFERDEELREMSNLIRKKERDKYLAEQAELAKIEKEKSVSSSSRESRRRRSRTRSTSSERRRRRSKRRRSRSRSRSKTKTVKKLVDY